MPAFDTFFHSFSLFMLVDNVQSRFIVTKTLLIDFLCLFVSGLLSIATISTHGFDMQERIVKTRDMHAKNDNVRWTQKNSLLLLNFLEVKEMRRSNILCERKLLSLLRVYVYFFFGAFLAFFAPFTFLRLYGPNPLLTIIPFHHD